MSENYISYEEAFTILKRKYSNLKMRFKDQLEENCTLLIKNQKLEKRLQDLNQQLHSQKNIVHSYSIASHENTSRKRKSSKQRSCSTETTLKCEVKKKS